jgi:hypothetical protein
MLLVSVRQELRETGVRRAFGAQRADIALHFLSEGVLLSAAGSAGGPFMGGLVCWAMRTGVGLPMSVSIFWAATGAAATVLAGTLISLFPAAAAARIHPVEALRYKSAYQNHRCSLRKPGLGALDAEARGSVRDSKQAMVDIIHENLPATDCTVHCRTRTGCRPKASTGAAKVATARRLLKAIYWMLRNQQDFPQVCEHMTAAAQRASSYVGHGHKKAR